MREGQQQPALGYLVEELLLLVGALLGDDRAGRQGRVQHRLRRQPATDLGEHQHDFELPGLQGVEAQPEDAGLGQLPPHLAAPTQVGLDDLIAPLGVVVVRQQIPGGVAQQFLLVAELKVHVLTHNPRMVEAMMVRCTSLLPP